jgi:multidrug efflux pump subunit AcrA (membrane-fusion protein)
MPTLEPFAESVAAAPNAMTDTSDNWVNELDFDGQLGVSPAGRRLRWLRFLVLPALALLVIGVALWILKPFASTAATPVTAQATTGTIVSSVDLSGSVASSAIKELNFGSAGTVTAVKVVPGDKVTSGEVLATVDDASLNVQTQTAQANLDAATAKLSLDKAGPTAATIASAQDSVRQAKLQLATARQSLGDTYAQNNQSLAQANADLKAAKATLATDKASLPAGDPQLTKDAAAVTQATQALSSAKLKATLAVHQATNQVSSASLAVSSAEHGYTLKIAPATSAQIASDNAGVAAARLALSNLQQTGAAITSPIDGTVTAVSIVVGQTVSAASASSSSSASSTTTGQIEVMDLANLQIAGQATETDVPKLKMGQAATISAAALGSETVVGKVCALSVVGTQISGVTSFGVTVCISGANPALLVGMSATAAVVTNRADGAVLVPSLAVKTVGGQQVVTVLGSDGTSTTNVPVTVGITNGSTTQITSGLTAGATIVETLQSTTTNRAGGAGGGRFIPGGGGFGGG